MKENENQILSKLQDIDNGQTELKLGQLKLKSRTENIEKSQQELLSIVDKIEKGQQELLNRTGNLEKGQQELISRIGNLEKGQELLISGQNEMKELLIDTATLLKDKSF